MPTWNKMNGVNAFRDLQFGGIAFQDTNAKNPNTTIVPPIHTGPTVTVLPLGSTITAKAETKTASGNISIIPDAAKA